MHSSWTGKIGPVNNKDKKKEALRAFGKGGWIMENMEKVDLLRERADVSYEEAKAVL